MKIADIKVDLIDHMGSDLSVVNAARVSFAKESDWDSKPVMLYGDHYVDDIKVLKDGDVKLINYLAKHKHFSPFNHAFLSVRVKAPIFVARQLVKHKFMPWNEVSRRYVDDEPEFYIPTVFREKADNVKQGSGGVYTDDIWTCSAFGYVGSTVRSEMTASVTAALNIYKDAMHRGVCPEQARMILPQNTMTEWIWSGSLGAFADMLKLRLDSHTQQETQDVAELIFKEVDKLFPVSLNALLENK